MDPPDFDVVGRAWIRPDRDEVDEAWTHPDLGRAGRVAVSGAGP
ncbi:hypothetical protein [Streptomyces xanthophaeus]